MSHSKQDETIEDNVKEFIVNSRRRVQNILDRLGWTEEAVLKDFNSNSKAASSKLNNQKITKPACSEQKTYPDSCFCENSVKLETPQLHQLLNDSTKEAPQNFIELQRNFNREQKLRIYNYVIENTNKLEVKTVLSSVGDLSLADIVAQKKREKQKKRKFRKSKPTVVEEMRSLVDLQMQALEQFLGQEHLLNRKEYFQSSQREYASQQKSTFGRGRKRSRSKSQSRLYQPNDHAKEYHKERRESLEYSKDYTESKSRKYNYSYSGRSKSPRHKRYEGKEHIDFGHNIQKDMSNRNRSRENHRSRDNYNRRKQRSSSRARRSRSTENSKYYSSNENRKRRSKSTDKHHYGQVKKEHRSRSRITKKSRRSKSIDKHRYKEVKKEHKSHSRSRSPALHKKKKHKSRSRERSTSAKNYRNKEHKSHKSKKHKKEK